MTAFTRPWPMVSVAALLTLALQVWVTPTASASDLGRLFYTPAQRSELEAAHAEKTRTRARAADADSAAAVPLRYDGVLIRSDGGTVRWANGRATDARAVRGLKPGQVRADGKVYEPYQVVPAAPSVSEELTP